MGSRRWSLLLSTLLLVPIASTAESNTPAAAPTGITAPPTPPSGKPAQPHSHAPHSAPIKKMSKKAAAKQKQLIGKWKQVGGADEVEFDKDGGFRASNPDVSMQGSYSVHDNGDVAIEIGLGKLTKGPLIRKIDIKGNEMVLRDDASNTQVRYQRAK